MLPVALLVSFGVATPAMDQPMSYDPVRAVQRVADNVERLKSLAVQHAHLIDGRKMSEEGEIDFDSVCEYFTEDNDEIGDEHKDLVKIFACFCTDGFRSFLEKHEDTFDDLSEGEAETAIMIMTDLFPVLCADDACQFFLDAMFTGFEESDEDGFAAGDKMADCVCERPNVMVSIMLTALEYETEGKEPTSEREFIEKAFDENAVGFCSSTVCKEAIQAQPDISDGLVDSYCGNVPPPSGGTLVKLEATIKGTVDDFDEDAYKGKLAAYLDVKEADITITVSGGSIKVTAEIETGNPENAVSAVMKLDALAEDPEIASDVLGVEVESLEVEDPTNASEFQESGGALTALNGGNAPIIGGVVGGVAFLAILGLIWHFKCRKRGSGKATA